MKSKIIVSAQAREIGRAVKNYRKSLDMKRQEFADFCDVSLCSIERWERGLCRPPFEVLQKLLHLK